MGKNKGYRDMSVPYTDTELQELHGIFQALPTYKNGQILATDIPELIHKMRYERTPEQVNAYQLYWEEHCEGKVTWDEFVSSAKSVHKTSSYARDYAIKCDLDGNGFISSDEFKPLLDLLVHHDPKLTGKKFEDFVSEADVNLDGKVSIDECVDWIEKNTKN